MELNIIHYLIVASIVGYWIFDYFDGRQVKDERYEWIRLKTFEFMQRSSLLVLTLLSIAFLVFPNMSARYPIILFVFCTLYGEIIGKLYFRRKY